MIVTLVALKLALGVAGDSENAALTDLEARAAAWVQEQTHRRFDEPEARTEYRFGTGARLLYLAGHIDDPDGAVAVRERFPRGEWQIVTDFERRRDALARTDGCWDLRAEYEIAYDDGYEEAPGDIQAVVIEHVRIARASSTSTAGLTSTTLGEYKETFDTGAAAATLVLSTGSVATVNRWRPRFV